MIEKFETIEATVENMPGYHLQFTVVPPGLSPNHPSRKIFDDRTIGVPNELGSLWCWIYQTGNQIPVATAVFAASRNSVLCDTIDVHEVHRRKGLATFLYDLAEQIFEIPAAPSEILSDSSQAFWKRGVYPFSVNIQVSQTQGQSLSLTPFTMSEICTVDYISRRTTDRALVSTPYPRKSVMAQSCGAKL